MTVTQNKLSFFFETLKTLLYICLMEFKVAKNKFVQTWGALGSQWGINKTMAQIHALLMISNEAISMEDIMEELQISRGNASMNIRALMDWGIVYKEYKAGERREFFTAEKDLDELAVKISRERSKREIKPALKVLKEVSSIEANKTEEEKHFIDQTTKLYDFVLKADNVLDKITEYKDNWLAKLVVKIMKK
ncbi:MAG: DNA-binding transcriptional regulator GbsR (MarR family) [Flavobacterium sp.]|jgi:DNA-binding transcriptional regulator GbsR (MarR family)